jgi:hypothetical protein
MQPTTATTHARSHTHALPHRHAASSSCAARRLAAVTRQLMAAEPTNAAATGSGPAANKLLSPRRTDGVTAPGGEADVDAAHSSRQIPLFQQGNEKLRNAAQTESVEMRQTPCDAALSCPQL